MAALVYAATVQALNAVPRPTEKDLLSVAVPAPMQIVLFGGDRYLAANSAVFRALVVGTDQLDQPTYEILGRVQSDAARLNPAHEDNYYLSQAILPWNGEIETDLFIQEQATKARQWDHMPPFFLGFDKFYFLKDPQAGAESLRIAAERSPPGDREALASLAARWSEKGDDPRAAIRLIEAMAQSARDKELKRYLEMRIERLRGLARLRDAAAVFAQRDRRPLTRVEELVTTGLLHELPVDPLGQGYVVDAQGVPQLAKSKPARQ